MDPRPDTKGMSVRLKKVALLYLCTLQPSMSQESEGCGV